MRNGAALDKTMYGVKRQSRFSMFWEVFSHNKPAVAGLVIVIALFLVAALADVIVPYESVIKISMKDKLMSPCAEHIFGTDNLGRDIFARIVHGSRISLTMGFLPTFVSLFIGMVFGAIAAYFGGRADNIIMRVCDVFACIPALLLALTFVAVLGAGLFNMLLAITISSIPSRIRYVRSVIMNIVEMEYIEAGRASGTRSMGIIFKHVLPNAVGPLILSAASSIAGMIMVGAGLSFLGLGIQPPDPEWGYMLSESKEYLMSAAHFMLFPGLAILISILSFNLVGDGLRDALDPKLRK